MQSACMRIIMLMNKITFSKVGAFIALVSTIIVGFSGVVSAHVVVRPKQVGVAVQQLFTVSVPNEKEMPVTKVRLAIPSQIKAEDVMPNAKAGWTVTKTDKEIIWTGGTIPTGLRDDFPFSAQVPGQETTLEWKAYQTYEDGTEVSWDQSPEQSSHGEEGGNTGPYSKTEVVNDVAAQDSANVDASSSSSAGTESSSNSRVNVAIALSIVALLFSLSAYATQRKKSEAPRKKKK